MVLPDGFTMPPVEYALVVVLASAAVAVGLWRRRPPVTEWTVIAVAPWMAMGGGLHVLWVLDLAPPWSLPLLASPMVYLSTAVLAGLVWLAATLGGDRTATIDGALGVAGATGLVAVAVVIIAVAEAPGRGSAWILLGIGVSLLVTGVAWFGFQRLAPSAATTTGWAGAVVVFGHVFDGVTTSIGIDVFGTGEQSPIPRLIMEWAATLPTAEFIGAGWLFLVVKIALAVGVVWLFAEFVEEAPRRGYLLLALLAAVGLGPGAHNLLLVPHVA